MGNLKRARSARLLPAGLLPDLTVGLVLGALGVTFSISLTALIYGAEQQQYMARTIGMVLTGGILLGLIVSLLTSTKGIIAHVQDAPAAVLGALAASMTVSLVGPQERWLTTLAMTLATTLVTGLLYFVVGTFRLGGLVRYLPYPVLGGFMAGTGWLLLVGGIDIMSGVHLGSFADLRELFAPDLVFKWLPGLALAIALLVLSERVKHFLVWPLSLLTAIAAFYLVMLVSGGSPQSWRAAGLLVGPFPQGSLFDPLAAAELATVRWDVVATQLPGILTVAFVCLIAMLLNATGIEEVAGRKVELNRELRAAGLGNLLSGAFGGAPGYQGLSFTAFNYTAGSGGRLASVVAAAVMAATLFFGAGAIQLLPTMVIGGLVAFFGLGFLYDWLVAALSRLPRGEYLVMLAIFAAIVTLGVLPGVGVGLVLAVALFVVASSRTVAVRYATDLTTMRSRVSRPQAEREVLARHGEGTLVIQLQGFLFFGTATALAEYLRRHGAGARGDGAPHAPTLDAVVLDFQRVTGVDSSGIATVGSLARAARAGGTELIICDAPSDFRRRVLAAAGGEGEASGIRFFADLDAALEHCERRLLGALLPATPADAAAGDVQEEGEQSLETGEGQESPVEAAARRSFEAVGLDLARLAPYLDRRELAPEEALIRRGDAPGALYFLVDGQLTASLPGARADGVQRVRLETMSAGSLVGELSFYRTTPRSADVTADTAATVMVLSESELERMTREQPALAAQLHRQVARLMAGRVAHLVAAVESLQR